MKKLSPVFALLLTGIGAAAADLSWTGTANTQWNSPLGWSVFSGSSVSGYPESGDVALYNGNDNTSGAVGSGNTLISGTQSALALNSFNTANIDIIGTNGTLNLGTYTRNAANGATSFRSSGGQSFSISIGNIVHTAGTTYFGQNAGAQGLTSFVSTGTTSLNGGTMGFSILNSGTAALNVVNVNGGTMSVRQTSSTGTNSVSIANLNTSSGLITTSAGNTGMLLVSSGSLGGAFNITSTELVKVGSGTLRSNVTSNLTLSQVTVREGVFAYVTSGIANQLSNSTSLTIDGGTVDMANLADAIGSFTLMSGTLTGAGTGRINASGGYNLQSGVINGGLLGSGGSVTKTTAGTVTTTGAHTYSGSTSITGGVLAVTTISNGGVNSTLGNNSSAAGNLILDGGTLSYVGSGAGSTDRLFTLGTNGGGLDSSGAGALTFSNTGSVVLAGTNTARTFTLSGSNTGANTYAGTIGDNGTGRTSLMKSGAGLWILTGDQTFTGTTTVSQGTLQLGSSGTTGSVVGAIDVGSAGTLAITRNANYTFNNTVTGSGIVNAGATGTTAFTSAFSGFSGTVQQNGSASNYIGAANFDSFANATVSTANGGGSGRIVTLAGTGTYSFGGVNAANSFSLTAGSTLRLGGNNSNSIQTAGAITASGGFIKVGTGTMTFASVTSNTFTGGIWLNDGVVALQAANAFGASGNISFGGGILQYSSGNTTDYSNRISPVASGQQVRIDTNGQAVSFGSAFSGSGGLQKLGSGTLTLAAANTYEGASVVSAGTLLITNATGAGTGAVNLGGGTVHVNVSSGAGAIANAVVFNSAASSYVLERASGQSLAVYAASSDLSGGIDTAASILAGTAGSSRTLTTSFSTIAVATNDGGRLSDVFSLAGTSTDLFVLQLDLSSALESFAYLAWLNGGSWVNAVNGNTGNNASLAQQGYQGSFSAFQIAYGSTLSNYVGAYGVDTTNGSAWAVLNHNSDFAVIPEPSTWALLALGFGALVLRARSRRRVV